MNSIITFIIATYIITCNRRGKLTSLHSLSFTFVFVRWSQCNAMWYISYLQIPTVIHTELQKKVHIFFNGEYLVASGFGWGVGGGGVYQITLGIGYS